MRQQPKVLQKAANRGFGLQEMDFVAREKKVGFATEDLEQGIGKIRTLFRKKKCPVP